MNRSLQVLGSCLLVFAPILFAGVIFAISFKRSAVPDRAFGVNIAGAMMGGLAEYTSMLLGFQYLVLVAILFYALSAIGLRKSRRRPKKGKERGASPPSQPERFSSVPDSYRLKACQTGITRLNFK